MVFKKQEVFRYHWGLNPIPDLPSPLAIPLVHTAEFNLGIRCIYGHCVRGFWRHIPVSPLLA